MNKPVITEENMLDILHNLYEKSMIGIPGSKNCSAVAEEYLNKHPDNKIAADKFINNQILKCSMSGFITSLGGIITLPVAVPANVVSVLYVQIRMIATLAVMGGYNLNDDAVQTAVYACLVGTSVADTCKSAGIKIANKTTTALLKKLPGTVCAKVNKIVGFKLLTKFGEKKRCFVVHL